MVKLIIVEGLPGSGKSTTAKTIYNVIQSKCIDVHLFSEGDYNHPADFEGVSFFSSKEFCELQKNYLSDEGLLDSIKLEKSKGFLIPYRKAIEEQRILFSEQLLNDITRRDIYDLAIDIHTELIVNRWKEFVDRSTNDDKVIIFEYCFIQNPITVTMIRDGASKEVSKNYVNRLAELIKPLEPILIYVEQDSIEQSFRKAIEDRPKEWFEGFSSYYLNQGYGLLNHLNGVEGVLKILEERSNLEKEIYNQLTIDKYIINNTQFEKYDLEYKVNRIINRYY
jgi:adenylate kinase family enzyme